jgi:TonB family protein
MLKSLGLASAPVIPAPAFFSWVFPGAAPEIRLSPEVAERLYREAIERHESGHGIESGGLLLGAVSQGIVEIKDYRPLHCAGCPDRHSVLKALAKRKGVEESLVPDGPAVVGTYHSHPRDTEFLEDGDLAVCRVCLSDAAGVFLLIKPAGDGSCSAGVALWRQGAIQSGFVFKDLPFGSELSKLGRALEEEAAPAVTTQEPSAGIPSFAADAEDRPHQAKSWFRMGMVAGAVSLAAILAGGALFLQKGDTGERRVPVVAENAVPAGAPSGRPSPTAVDGAVPGVQEQPLTQAPAEDIAEETTPAPDGGLPEGAVDSGGPKPRATRAFVPPAATRQQAPAQITSLDPPPVQQASSPWGSSGLTAQLAPGTPVAPPPAPPTEMRQAPPPKPAEPVKTVDVSYVQPRAVRRVEPSVPTQFRRTLINKDTEVEVNVQIDANGRVTGADVVSGTASKLLGTFVTNAARSWSFEPARMNGKPVASETRILFLFRALPTGYAR